MADAPVRTPTHLDIGGIWIDCSLREQHGLTAQCTQFPVEDGPNVTDHVRLQSETLQLEGIVSNTPLEQPKSHFEGAIFDYARTALLEADGQGLHAPYPVYTTRTIEGEPIIGWINLLPTVGRGRLEDSLSRDMRRYEPRKQLQIGFTENQWTRQTRSMYAMRTTLARTLAPDELDAEPLDPTLGVNRVKAVATSLRDTFRKREPIKIVTAFRIYPRVVLTDLSITRDAQTAGALHFRAQAQVIELVQLAHGTAQVDPSELRATPAKQKGTQATTPAKPGEVPQGVKDDASLIIQGFEALQPPEPGH